MKLQQGGKAVLTPRIYKGAAESVAVGSLRDISVTVQRGQSGTLTKQATVNAPLVAPLKARERVGEYTVTAGDEVVARVPLVALAAVEEGGFWHSMTDTVRLWFE